MSKISPCCNNCGEELEVIMEQVRVDNIDGINVYQLCEACGYTTKPIFEKSPSLDDMYEDMME